MSLFNLAAMNPKMKTRTETEVRLSSAKERDESMHLVYLKILISGRFIFWHHALIIVK